jgi:hypothetical protein
VSYGWASGEQWYDIDLVTAQQIPVFSAKIRVGHDFHSSQKLQNQCHAQVQFAEVSSGACVRQQNTDP